MTDKEDADRQAAVALDAFEEATWDAIESYRITGELVPVTRDGKLEYLTVDEALHSRRDYVKRRDQTGRRKCAKAEPVRTPQLAVTNAGRLDENDEDAVVAALVAFGYVLLLVCRQQGAI